MAISSNTLFHFTSKEKLFGILEDEFQPKYCLETFGVGDSQMEAAIPMVSFCDIPLSQIKNHIKIYGKYGLGMTKSWAKGKKLNPVLYLREGSMLAKHIESISNYFIENSTDNDKIKDLTGALIDMLRYIKPYSGNFYRPGGNIPDVKFYDEREWRYVPKTDKYGCKYILKKDDFLDENKRIYANDSLCAATLSFEPRDIRYIILKSETEILPTIEALKKIKSKYNKEVIELLTTRIITSARITNDF